MGTNLPTGTVTFLFTDIEGSTRLWQEQPQAMAVSHERHNAILRQAIESEHGYVVDIVGDAFAAAFHNARDGLQAALSAQRSLQAEAWGETVAIRVRMGLHTGAAEISTDGSNKYHESYTILASTQRVMSAAYGGQVLLSQTTYDLLQNVLPAEVSLRDMGEHRLKDLRSPVRLYQLVAPGLLQDFPALKSLNNLPNNLPIHLTRFVGRGQELSEVERLLARTRLLTLTGPGGTGKTRLALQGAAAELEQFPQGAWLVELAPVTDPQIVVQAIANVFSVRETPGRSLLEALIDYLRYKSLLLVLDNCEHLIEACAQLADNLLHACPNLKVLASSREALGIAGEVTFRVPSLSLPPASFKDGSHSLADLEQSEAVRLFVERAQAVSPAFCLGQENALAVAQICRRLDGIPLALELAAARVKVLTPTQIASRLDDRFRLLTGGSRTALPRQQTLKALIDWSWTLLSDTEKTLLRRLAVFTGGFTLEAVEMICTDPVPASAGEVSLAEYEILDLLEGLVNKSLIQVGEEGSQARYRLLETIRQFAREQLHGSNQEGVALERHARYYAQLVSQAAENQTGQSLSERLRTVQDDHDNLRGAFAWLLAHDGEQALALVAMLGTDLNFWELGGFFQEGRRWLQRALEGTQASVSLPRAQALLVAADLSSAISDFDYGLQCARQAQRLSQQLGDQRGEIDARLKYCELAELAGELANLQAQAEEALRMAERISYTAGIAKARVVLGTIAYYAGEHQAAIQYVLPSIALWRELVRPFDLATALNRLASALFEIHEYAAGQQALLECRDIYQSLGYQRGVALAIQNLGGAAYQLGDYVRARALFCDGLRIRRELGLQRGYAYSFEFITDVNEIEKRYEHAVQLLAAAETLRVRIGAPIEQINQKENEEALARLRAQLGDVVFELEWAKGATMTAEQAIALALS